MNTENNIAVNLGTESFYALVDEEVRIPITLKIGILQPGENQAPSAIILDISEFKAKAEAVLDKEITLNAETFDSSGVVIYFTDENI